MPPTTAPDPAKGPAVPPMTPDQRRIASESFDRARQVLQTGNFDYAIQLLKVCCLLDPANLTYRRQLRKAQKDKYGPDKKQGSRFAFLSAAGTKGKLKAAKAQGLHLKVLEHGEEVLSANPWDLGAQMDMAEAFVALGLSDLAVYTLDQARDKYPKDPTLNRTLARLFEQRHEYKHAITLWQLVADAVPNDEEAKDKAKNLDASRTIKDGNYEAAGASAAGQASGWAAPSATPAATPQDRLSRETAAIQKRLEADPTEPTLYVQLAQVYRRHGDDDRARQALRQGLGPTGGSPAIQLVLDDLDLEADRKQLAAVERKLAEAAAADDPVDDLAGDRDRLRAAVQAREVAIARARADQSPADLNLRLELGRLLYRQGKVDEAVPELQQVRKDDRLKGKAALLLGLGFKRKGNWRLAQRNLEEAVAGLPQADEANHKLALYELATGFADNGEVDRAVEVGSELANIDFGFKDIGKKLDDWQKRA